MSPRCGGVKSSVHDHPPPSSHDPALVAAVVNDNRVMLG
jgi:hypothetical protein